VEPDAVSDLKSGRLAQVLDLVDELTGKALILQFRCQLCADAGLVLRVWPVFAAQVALYAYYGRDLTYPGMLATIGSICIAHGVGVGMTMLALGGWWNVG
jgi:uncharacterized membrane protein YjfL (UPF0719 family)